MVYRAEVMQLGGAWDDAIEEARRACEWLSSPASPEGAAGAHYQLGELHRLRGDYAHANDAYLEAGRAQLHRGSVNEFVETLIEEALRIADEMAEAGGQSGRPDVVVAG